MQYNKIELGVNEVKKRIGTIDKLNPKKHTIKDYELHIFDLISKMIAHSYFIPSKPEPIICRARPGEHSNIAGLMNPPKEYVKDLGRMNDIGESKFYACIGPNAHLGSLDEIRLDDGCYVTQLFFKVTKTITPILGIGHSQSWLSGEPLNVLSKSGLTGDELKKQTILTRWLHSSFLKVIPQNQNEKYKKTIAISNCYSRLFDSEAILFPSVTSTGDCTNLVLSSSLALNNLEPVKARILISYKDKSDKGYLDNYVKESESIDLNSGEIKWKNMSLCNDDAKKILAQVDKTKLISLGEGRYAFPHPTEPNRFCTYSTIPSNIM